MSETTRTSWSVLRPWVMHLPWKQQSEYLSALRGPDHAHCPQVKRIVKGLRAAAQYNADTTSGYMREARRVTDWRQLEHELEYCSLHFVSHLVSALVTLQRAEPMDDDGTDWGEWAANMLTWFADTYHLRPA